MLKLLREGDEMKEKILKNKSVIAIGLIVILNLLWLAYPRTIAQEGVLIENEESHEQTERHEMVQDDPETKEEVRDKSPIPHIEEQSSEKESMQSQTDDPFKEERKIVSKQVPIYICGEVLQPGVYEVANTAIINDVVEKAGGLTREADLTAINLASPIQPNEKIIIPKEGQEIDKLEDSYENRERNETLPSAQQIMASSAPASNETLSELININTATKEQLMTLNGIGAVKAEAIIAYRQEKGRFDSIDEIMQISGIGDKTFEKIKQFITT